MWLPTAKWVQLQDKLNDILSNDTFDVPERCILKLHHIESFSAAYLQETSFWHNATFCLFTQYGCMLKIQPLSAKCGIENTNQL